MRLIVPSRRGFITGLTALLAAPSIVRAANLMPVSVAKTWPTSNMSPGLRITNTGTAPIYFGDLAVMPGCTEEFSTLHGWYGVPLDMTMRPVAPFIYKASAPKTA